ncbi:hypothetical protein V8C86DRAFT_316669 [Haematococcus lacustris]
MEPFSWSQLCWGMTLAACARPALGLLAGLRAGAGAVIPDRMLITTDFPSGETTYTTASDGKQLKIIKRGTNLLVVDGKGSSAVLVGRSNIQWNGNVVHLVDKVLLP